MADQSLTDFSQAVNELAKTQQQTNDTLKNIGQTVGKEVVSAGQDLISPFTSALSQIPGFKQLTGITKILGKQLVSGIREKMQKNLLAKQLGLSKTEFKSLERQKKLQDAQAKHLGTMESAAESLLGLSKEEVKKRRSGMTGKRSENIGGGKETERKLKQDRKDKKQQDVLMEIAENTKQSVEGEEETSKLGTVREVVQTNYLRLIARDTKKHFKLTGEFMKQQHKDLTELGTDLVVAVEESNESKKGLFSMLGLAAIFIRLASMFAAILPILKVLGFFVTGIGALLGATQLIRLLPKIFDFILDWKGFLGMPSLRELGDSIAEFFGFGDDGVMTKTLTEIGDMASRSGKAIVDAVINPTDPVTTPLRDEALMKRGQEQRDIFGITDSPTSEQLLDAVGTPEYAGLAMTIDQQRNIELREERRKHEKELMKRDRGKMTGEVSTMLEDRKKMFGGRLTAERILKDFKAAEEFKSDIAKPFSVEDLLHIGDLSSPVGDLSSPELRNKTDTVEDAFTFRMKEKIRIGDELSMGERLEMRYIQERKEAESALQRLETARQGGIGAGTGETNVVIDASNQSERDVLLPTSFDATLHRRKDYFLEAGNLATA